MPRKPGEEFIKKQQQRNAAARKVQIKNYDYFKRNKETRDAYHSKEWTAVRNTYIAQHPLCEDCLSQGQYITATEVHHIKPLSEGGRLLDIHNLRSLCHACHMRTHGFKDNTKHKDTEINVVYGAPCSGKTTFVNKRFRHKDLVFDLDMILSVMSNTPVHSYACQGHIDAMLAMRSALISYLADRSCTVSRAWIIITDPGRIRRQLPLATYWCIDTPQDVCIARAVEANRGTEILNAIKHYFLKITKDSNDKRIGGGGSQKSTDCDS